MSPHRELPALLDLARAHLASRAVRIRFRDTERTTAERTVDVLALAFDPPRWLVATWSPARGSLRLLDLARVLRVRGTRRRAGPPPEGFDPIHFATRKVLLPGGGRVRPAVIRLEPPWASVARALLPTCTVRPGRRGGGLLRVPTNRPDVVAALGASLGAVREVDCGSSSWPEPERGRSLTRRDSSASPPGSWSRASRSPGPRSTRRSRTSTAGGPTRPSGSSRGTRRR